MSLQVFLQAQLLGIEEFLASHHLDSPEPATEFTGRCAWLSLICEVLPRALLSRLRLSRMLLGSSSAEQFLLVLTDEMIPAADEFLEKAALSVSDLSGGVLRLVWSSTENLGVWPVARKRLDNAIFTRKAAALSTNTFPNDVFGPFTESQVALDAAYFTEFGRDIRHRSTVGWSADAAGRLQWDGGEYTWRLKDQSDGDEEAILFPRRYATEEDGATPLTLEGFTARSEGNAGWGVLSGDVDGFDARLRSAASIEDHIHLSLLFKEFFAGELSILCTLPEFWRKITILYRGGDDFVVVGAWDALVALARELERLFERFIDANLQTFAGIEAKTLSMSLAIATTPEAQLSTVFEEAYIKLRVAKAVEVGTFFLFGRTLEWKRLPDAEELKGSLVRLVRDFGYAPAYIHDLAAVYREAFTAQATRRNKAIRIDKPWRTYLRVSRVIPQTRGKELNNVRSAVISNLLGKRTAGFKLRPSARVGLEWARLAAGD